MPEGHRLPAYVEAHPAGASVHVYVQPRAAKDDIVGVHGRALKVKITAPPVDDKANRAVAELLADRLGVPPRTVSLEAGRHSRNKRFAVASMEPGEVASALERVLSSRAP